MMKSLKEINNKKILLICAHPDDETLWFFQSILDLRTANDISILCLTYSADSGRGKELLFVAEKYNLNILFGNCKDTGINFLLQNTEATLAIQNTLIRSRYDLVITHPPHGGEKPHPHHIQTYFIAKKICSLRGIRFGFFSERKIISPNKDNFKYSMADKKFIGQQLKSSFKLAHEEKKLFLKWKFYAEAAFDIFLNKKSFQGYQATIQKSEKKEALMHFESQKTFLAEYNFFNGDFEYLYLDKK
jgi:LmbE family N-acetylglucosaminyl deacetylase